MKFVYEYKDRCGFGCSYAVARALRCRVYDDECECTMRAIKDARDAIIALCMDPAEMEGKKFSIKNFGKEYERSEYPDAGPRFYIEFTKGRMYLTIETDRKWIKICEENRGKIDDLAKKANGKRRVRCVDADDIFSAVKKLEKKYFDGFEITKTALSGSRFCIDIYGQSISSDYYWTYISSKFDLLYKHGQWYLLDVYRERTSCERDSVDAYLTDDAIDYITKRALNPLKCL